MHSRESHHLSYISEMSNSTLNSPDGDDGEVSTAASDLNIRSKSVSVILIEAGLSDTIQEELKEMFLKSKSENDKIDGSDSTRLKLAIKLLERLISEGTLENKFAKQLMDQIVIENLQARSLQKLLRRCLEGIQGDLTTTGAQTLDCWLAVLGRVLSTIQTFDTFHLPAEDGWTGSGQDFVSRAVLDICGLNWNSQIATSMCSMLKVSEDVS